MTTEKGSLGEGDDSKPDENRDSIAASRGRWAALGGLFALGLTAVAVAATSFDKGPALTSGETTAAYCPPSPTETQVSWPDTHVGAEFGVALSAVAVPSEVIVILPTPGQRLDQPPLPIAVS